MALSLPSDVGVEKLVLGGILMSRDAYAKVARIIAPEAFSLEKHRRIYAAMSALYDNGDPLDFATIANELLRRGELESVDGLSYLTSLDEKMPVVLNIESYARILRDKFIARQTIFLAQHVINQAGTHERPRVVIESAVEKLVALMPEDEGSGPQQPGAIIDTHGGGLNAFLQPHLNQRGVPTGFTRFDNMTGGLKDGELVLLGARPAMGKSAIALNIATHVAVELEKPVVVFSLEMTKKSLLHRIVCASARVDSQRFRLGYTNAEEREKLGRAVSKLSNAPLFIDDTAGCSPLDIVAKIRSLKAIHGTISIAIIDYLQLLRPPGKYENRVQEVTAISRMLKLIAKEEKLCVLALSQLNRASEQRRGDGRPQLADLKESGSLEADSDLVAFLYREEVYKRDREDLRGLAELIVAKQREGPTATVDLVFLHHLAKFENRAEDLGEPVEDHHTRDP